MFRIFLILAAVLATIGCSSTRPVLYPNEQFNTVGADAVDQEIEFCIELAEAAGADSGSGYGTVAAKTAGRTAVGAASGAVGGAIVGSAGTGSAIGAASAAIASLLYSLFSAEARSPAFENFVNRCLAERGYEIVGWD